MAGKHHLQMGRQGVAHIDNRQVYVWENISGEKFGLEIQALPSYYKIVIQIYSGEIQEKEKENDDIWEDSIWSDMHIGKLMLCLPKPQNQKWKGAYRAKIVRNELIIGLKKRKNI